MRRTLVHFPFHKILHERNRLVYPQHRDIYRKVVGGCNAPFLIRIIVIISSTRLVGLQHQFLRLFDRQVLAFDDPLNTVFLVVMNKETQAVRIVTKYSRHIVRQSHKNLFPPGYGSYRSDTGTNGR